MMQCVKFAREATRPVLFYALSEPPLLTLMLSQSCRSILQMLTQFDQALPFEIVNLQQHITSCGSLCERST
jgi:hypothetical protein